MPETFLGFLTLRLLALIPLSIVIAVAVGVSALARGADVLGIAVLAGVPIAAVAGLARLRALRR